MIRISDVLSGCSPPEARSAVYYAGRYIKQAKSFAKYSKDIFEDESRSRPSDHVRNLTMRLIRAIESDEGTVATSFDSDTVIRLLDELTEFEAGLSDDLSDDELVRGAAIAAGMTVPTTSS